MRTMDDIAENMAFLLRAVDVARRSSAEGRA
jgi:hypothetical protein